jgi:ABC-2 type transport system permease protein
MNSVAIRALIRNDLRLYLTDRRALVIGVVVPILIAAFFGYVFGGNGAAEAPGKIPIALVDEDQSTVSHAISADLAGESLLDVRTLNRSAAEERVRSGKAQVAAIIPKNFGAASMQALFSGMAKPRVELLIDPSQAISGRLVEGLFAQHGTREITKQAFGGGTSGQAPLGLQRGLSMPYGVETTKITSARNVPYNSYAHSFAGMTTQFILLAGIDAGIVLLLTRERGIWQRLRSAPLSKTEFLLARTLSTVLIGLFQFMLIYTTAIVIFGVRIGGSIIGFAALAVALCLLNAAFGLMLASIGRSAAATRGIAVMATLLLVMVGGAWVPSFVFPQWLQRVSLAAPTRWAVDGLDAMTWRGLGLHAAAAPVAVVCASAMLCLAVAIWRFRWEE